ncbi:MAG: biotin synthase BioB [Gammaproteobacteria bacterium]|nr:biotin synthase BioB [Gammaproteobacteria bacterium]MYL02133.1 biotin synthase BioB [Gammaproteobacteria bacterium]
MPDLTRADVAAIYHSPLLDLVYRAATVHREHHAPGQVQLCTLLSVKTGGCPEDCAYCPQAARYHTGIDRHGLLKLDAVLEAAREAREAGSTRFCMGAAWREVRDNRHFDEVLEMVSGVRDLGLEVCCTLGMLTESQAERLKEAGLYAYNHNLDSSREFYPEIIGTRTYDDRLETLANVHKAGLSVCCGGIIGMGETVDQRIDLLHTLATLPSPPESVPVNALVPVPGTPLEDCPPVSTWEMVRMIASARVLMPRAMVRLSAGRSRMSAEQQALCFLAGANSIFTGEKLLTTPNPSFDSDEGLLELLGLTPREPYTQQDTHAAA